MAKQRKKSDTKKKSAKPPNENRQSQIEDRQFIEIVNWKKAQPNMKDGGNDWMKLYTSLLEHEGFECLDDPARMLIIALWLYAARSGMYILPADPKWIRRRIPLLNSLPVLEPLMAAEDAYGNPTPFLAYCPQPSAIDTGSSEDEQPGKKPAEKRKKRTGTTVATRTRGAQREKRRVEKSREERREKREDETLSGFEREKKREKKERVNSAARKERGRTEQTEAEAEEPEKPENPKDSEVGAAKVQHIVPKPPHSVKRRAGPQSIGSVISDRFPEHWQDSDAETFGWEIIRALGLSDDPHNATVRSEWGAFARFWWRVKRVAPVMLLDDLRAIAVRKAVYVRTKGKSARNPRAVWTHIMYGELAHRGVNISPPARASPVQRAKR